MNQAAPAANAEDLSEYDSFYQLPLGKWDIFDSVTLKASRVVLASDLKPVIDFFNNASVGVGARTAKQSADELKLAPDDRSKIEALLKLRSYDVYSLRAALGPYLSDEQLAKLRLPDAMRELLEGYTLEYTKSLFRMVFNEGVQAKDRESMRALFGTGSEAAQRNLMLLARTFAINPDDLADYIAQLGEILVAISFYRRCFEVMDSEFREFLKDVKALSDDKQLQYRFLNICNNGGTMVQLGAFTVQVLRKYFDNFNNLGNIWPGMTADKFKTLKMNIEDQYPIVGAILCIWQVKIKAWMGRFRDHRGRVRESSGDQRATFFSEQIWPNFSVTETLLKRIDGVKLIDAA